MSQYDDEHGIGVPCAKCGMPDCVSAKGCAKRQTEKRRRDELASLRAELAAAKSREARLLAQLHGTNSLNPGAAAEAAMWEAKAKELREALEAFPTQDVVPFVHEDGSTVRWVAALVRFEKLRLAALAIPEATR